MRNFGCIYYIFTRLYACILIDMRKNILALYYYIVLISLAAGFVVYKALTFEKVRFSHDRSAEKGVLDLTGMDPDGKIVPLKGEYEFYWSSLYTPADFDSLVPVMTGYMRLPGLWNGYRVNGEKLDGNGYATFRLCIDSPSPGMYAIKIKEFDCAYRLWANNREVGSGIVGESRKQMVPGWKRNELYFSTIDGKVNLVVQVSNFHHRKGGPEDIMLFGEADEIIKYKTSSVATETFALGFILLTFFFHLGLFFFRPSDKSNLHFAIINLLVALRLMLSGEKLLLDMIPGMSWYIATRLEYLSVVLPAAFFIFFLHTAYPAYERKTATYTAIVIAGIMSLIIILFPASVYTYIAIIVQPFVLIAIIYSVNFMHRVLKKKEKHAIFIMLGILFFGIGAVNEFLFYNQMIHTGYLLPFTLLVLIFTISFGLSGKFSHALEEATVLKAEIEEYSHQLEEKVRERTMVTENQKKLLEVQTEELRIAVRHQIELGQFKENMVNLAVHDMKNPLGAIITLDENASAEHIMLARCAGNQLMNLVQNIVEIQKFEDAVVRLKPEEHDLNLSAQEAVMQVSFLSKQKKISMFNNLPSSTLTTYDPYMIERVFVNLLQNAVKYVPEGGTVAIELMEKNNREIRVSVKDNGPGIPEKFHTVIFEKYGQVTESTTKKSTGLGLAFCKMAVEAHSGKIGVISKPGNGSTFWFTLPVNTV